MTLKKSKITGNLRTLGQIECVIQTSIYLFIKKVRSKAVYLIFVNFNEGSVKRLVSHHVKDNGFGPTTVNMSLVNLWRFSQYCCNQLHHDRQAQDLILLSTRPPIFSVPLGKLTKTLSRNSTQFQACSPLPNAIAHHR